MLLITAARVHGAVIAAFVLSCIATIVVRTTVVMETATQVERNAEDIAHLIELVKGLSAEPHAVRQSGPPVAFNAGSVQAKKWASDWYDAENIEPTYTDRSKDIGERIVAGLREFDKQYSQGNKTTPLLRRLAEYFVELRSEFRDPHGDTDWRGKTWEYRTFVGDLYDRSGVDHEVRYKLQTGLRYHVSNELRRAAPADELEDAGLIVTSARTRQGEARRMQSDLVADLGDGKRLTNMSPSASRSWELSVAAARRCVRRLDGLDPVDLTAAQREMLSAELASCCTILTEVASKL